MKSLRILEPSIESDKRTIVFQRLARGEGPLLLTLSDQKTS
jgi:hypothetical protein